jgi:uncharacterized membrane protein YfcA
MPEFLIPGGQFIEIDIIVAIQVIVLGFVGGVLSGFIGSGGAFFMTPGMMNLGVPGAISVASNITHKFGKAMIGQKSHGEMGHVDKKLAVFMLVTAAGGINFAVFIQKLMFTQREGQTEAQAAAMSNLYISAIFVLFLSVVAVSMLRDIIKSRKAEDMKPSRKIVDFLNRMRLPPMIYFPIADVHVSLWVILVCGFATGYLAGTIGVGGFIGVPSMIYVFGVPAAVAAGTELYLAMFMGAWGLFNYALAGMVDLRLTLLLYLGSLFGIHLGVYGTKVVREVIIRLATSIIILLCVVSRAVNVPAYLRELGYVRFDPALDVYFNGASKALLYASGVIGGLIILYFVFRAYVKRQKVRASLVATS